MAAKKFKKSLPNGVSYDAVRQAMAGEPYIMSLTGEDAESVRKAVNRGIDSHLEACNCPERGDSYTETVRRAGKLVLCGALDCTVSPESMPTLLRRLEDGDENARSLGEHILEVILTPKE